MTDRNRASADGQSAGQEAGRPDLPPVPSAAVRSCDHGVTTQPSPGGLEIPPCESEKRDVPLLSATDTPNYLELGPSRDLASRSDAAASWSPQPAPSSSVAKNTTDASMLEQSQRTAAEGRAWCARIDADERTAAPPTTTLIAPRAAYRGSKGTLEALRAWLPKQGQR